MISSPTIRYERQITGREINNLEQREILSSKDYQEKLIRLQKDTDRDHQEFLQFNRLNTGIYVFGGALS